MRINHNLSALNAWKNMSVNDSGQNKSLEKLSSGLRIGRAADDAAGLSISEKMRGQISGLNQASRNAQDGISLLQTAEGALQETHSILQRMRELAVQAASDTVTNEDRLEIQKEIDNLRVEMDRISTDTEFNTQKLLNGKFTEKIIHIGANAQQNLKVSIASMGARDLKVNKVTTASSATTLTNVPFIAEHAGDATLTVSGTYTGQAPITALRTSITEDGKVRVIGKRDGAEGDLIVDLDSGATSVEVNGLTFAIANIADVRANATTIEGGPDDGKIDNTGDAGTATEFSFINGDGATLAMSGTATENITGISATVVGDGQVQISYTIGNDTTRVTLHGDDASATAEHTVAGVTFKLTGAKNVREAATTFTWEDDNLPINAEVVGGLDVVDEGINVSTQAAADAAITVIDEAIVTVSGERSKLGAIQNRLEHTIANLSTSSENLTAAESRIRDVDIAVEMMNFTKYQILSQASTAMLAQANAKPQAVLQLLR
ncbi:MAG TPA: flagellin [Bacillota bacterium]|nr:flagellin [Bacillota bacterium]